MNKKEAIAITVTLEDFEREAIEHCIRLAREYGDRRFRGVERHALEAARTVAAEVLARSERNAASQARSLLHAIPGYADAMRKLEAMEDV